MIAWNFETGMWALGQEILWCLELFVMMLGEASWANRRVDVFVGAVGLNLEYRERWCLFVMLLHHNSPWKDPNCWSRVCH